MPENVAALSSDVSQLDKLFDMTEEKKEKIKGIKSRLEMPDPDKKNSVTVRFLYYSEKDGSLKLYRTVSGPKFKNVAVYFNVEDVQNPGVQKDITMSKTLHMALTRALENDGMKFEDIPGKIFTLSADYWKSAPKNKRSKMCPKCRARGCEFCTVAGTGEDAGVVTGLAPPTRYDATLRRDLMGTGISEGAKGSVATEF